MRPGSIQEAATLLRGLQHPVRPTGGGTKPWLPARDEEVLETGGLHRIVEHNVGDFTAILEAGVPFAEAQAAFAAHGQRLSWDPPLSRPGASPPQPTSSALAGGATIGGIVATGDSGPLRHRYGGVRDLVVGTTVVLSDGTVAKSGGKVIKNVAGYDLAKLFAGSFGTLGLIASISVRLHPLPEHTATVVEHFDDPSALLARVVELARRPLEADCFDVVWDPGSGGAGSAGAAGGGSGRILVQFSGASADEQARRIGAPEEVDWDEVRALQRSRDGAVLKVSGRPTDLPNVIRAAGDATVVSRAALGLSWLSFAPSHDLADRVAAARQALSPRACTVLDGADRIPDQWPDPGPSLVVMERLKARFDPARIFRPGSFVGGI